MNGATPAQLTEIGKAVESLKRFEEMLRFGRFREVDAALAAIDVSVTGTTTLLAIATITAHGKDQLDADIRDAFIARAEAAMVQRIGAERTTELLRSRR